jgi:hypothetical protein
MSAARATAGAQATSGPTTEKFRTATPSSASARIASKLRSPRSLRREPYAYAAEISTDVAESTSATRDWRKGIKGAASNAHAWEKSSPKRFKNSALQGEGKSTLGR